MDPGWKNGSKQSTCCCDVFLSRLVHGQEAVVLHREKPWLWEDLDHYVIADNTAGLGCFRNFMIWRYKMASKWPLEKEFPSWVGWCIRLPVDWQDLFAS